MQPTASTSYPVFPARPLALLRDAPSHVPWVPVSARPPRLLDQVRGAIRARHYSRRTEKTYVAWIRRFILFHGTRHPTEMGEPEVTRFLTHLAVDAKLSAST